MILAARRKLRLRLRDMAALSAFIAVAISGTVPLWVIATFIGGWLGSMLGWRPLAKHPIVTVVLLLATAVLLFGAAFRGMLDLVVAAVAFALLVTTQRMLSEPDTTTDQQVLLASLLLMAGAAALSGEFWYAVSLLFFGVFSCLTLGLTVIEGPKEQDRDLPVRPVLRQVMLGVTVALLGGLAFFVLFPRLSWNLASRRTPPGVLGGTTGMSDRVRLGGGGTLKTNARVVVRARLRPDPNEDQLDRYWVGRFFDTFDGKEWKGSGSEQPPKPRVQLGPAGRKYLVQKIELLPGYDSRTLVGLDAPLIYDGAVALNATGQNNTPLIEVSDEEVHFASRANAYLYSVASRTTPQPAPTEAPDPKYLALPTLDPRVGALATKVAAGETDPQKLARKLERYLRATYEYTLELPGDVADPLTDFLFVRRAGHCEHFATALAVLLRTQGVHSRVTAGFFGGQRVNDAYVLRAGDAHAWVQAFVPGTGWVTFDATPDSGRRNNTSVILAALTTAYETVEQFWQGRVLDYSFQDQMQFVRELVRPPANRQEATGVSLSAIPKEAIFAGLGTGFIVFIAVRVLLRPAQARPHPMASFLDDIEQRLARAHIERVPGEGLEEVSSRLSEMGHPLAAPLAKAARRYLEARFGKRKLTREERDKLLAALVVPAP